MNKLILKNKHLPALSDWLSSLALGGKESRERTKFIELLRPGISELFSLRQGLLFKYAEKDEAGKPKMKTEEVPQADGTIKDKSTFDLTDENSKKFKEELTEFLNKDFVIEAEGNKSKLLAVKDLVLNSSQTFRGELAEFYAEWAECFEAMELD